MRVGIIGAGPSGLVAAKVLSRAGHDVVVHERSRDVGGVWSASKRYPGVTTQSPRDMYAFTDHPMPKDYPEWPDGEQVQRYYDGYATRFDLHRLLRLGSEVVTARPAPGGGWDLRVRPAGSTGAGAGTGGGEEGSTEHVDHLVVANGVFSSASVPDYPGADAFAAAGGVLVAANAFPDLERARGRRVVVVGYGKSSCDVAREASRVAAHVDVVARQLLWKVPRKVGGVVNFKYLLMTRMGEALFGWEERRGVEAFLHGRGDGLRRSLLNSLGGALVRQYRLDRLGLVPRGQMQDIVKGAIGLVTDGFYEQVAAGAITVHRDRRIARLGASGGRTSVTLDDGTELPADLVLCGTGYVQELPFLDEATRAQLVDERGDHLLYRHVLPVGVPGLSFLGYNTSFFSPLNAEVSAMWLAGVLAGRVALPSPARQRELAQQRLAHIDAVTGGHHAHGTKVIPFSTRLVDESLADLGPDVSRLTKVRQWVEPVDPADYAGVTRAVEALVAVPAAAAGTAGTAARGRVGEAALS